MTAALSNNAGAFGPAPAVGPKEANQEPLSRTLARVAGVGPLDTTTTAGRPLWFVGGNFNEDKPRYRRFRARAAS